MRRGDGGGPFRQLLSMIATLVMVGVLVVVLVSSGGWRTVSETLGIGNPDASTAALTESKKGDAGRNPDAKSLSGLLSLFGVHTGGEADAGAKDTGRTPDTGPTGDAAAWRAQLDAAGRMGTAKANPGGYDRETRFGGWAPSGCGKATTRDTILARDLTGVRKDSSCRVVSGTLRDPYTGGTIGFRRGVKTSDDVQIDHVVSLYDAWASGARDWDQAKRVEYANDPDVLLASDGPANMAKGSGIDVNGRSEYLTQHTGAPDIWMPDNKAYRCDYMAKRVSIKAKYGLTMTAREKQQTITYLAQCVAGKNQ